MSTAFRHHLRSPSRSPGCAARSVAASPTGSGSPATSTSARSAATTAALGTRADRAAGRRRLVRRGGRAPRRARRTRWSSSTSCPTRSAWPTPGEAPAWQEAVVSGRATIGSRGVVVAVMDFRFMGGSLGAAVGELDHPGRRDGAAPTASRCCSSPPPAARGCRRASSALMQMAKTAQALGRARRGRAAHGLRRSPTRPTAGWPPRSPCSATSSSPSPARGWASPAPG